MFASRAFFSMTELPNREDHRLYNEWHQLDHRPENLLLPGVAWGERWVHSPDCAALARAPDPLLRNLHYVNLYWFREPVEASSREWSELAERSFHWGRRGDVHVANRLLLAYFRPVKGYVNARVRLSADAMPFRPNRGIFLDVVRVAEPRAPAAERLFEWYDTMEIPRLLRCGGAVGAWTFASEETFATHVDLSGEQVSESTRIHVYFLDGDPLGFAREADQARDEIRAPDPPAPEIEQPVFSGPLRAITPWEWDWFD